MMMSTFDLAPHRTWLLQHALLRCAQLGKLAFGYLQGSLASGYTGQADLDVVLMWDQGTVPDERTGLVGAMDQAGRSLPFVVDYQDVHLERFAHAGQEYNVGHWALPDFVFVEEGARNEYAQGKWELAWPAH